MTKSSLQAKRSNLIEFNVIARDLSRSNPFQKWRWQATDCHGVTRLAVTENKKRVWLLQSNSFLINIEMATTYALIPLSSLRDLRNGSTLGVSFRRKDIFQQKKSLTTKSNSFLINIEMATTYLSGRLPSEYCRRWKSLRPCSGWERVVSFLFVTIKSFSGVHWKLHNNKLIT